MGASVEPRRRCGSQLSADPLGSTVAVTTSIDEARFGQIAGPLVGLAISAVWLGDYTALYLEIGPLTDVYPSGRPKAEHTAYFGFHWVLESDAGQELSSTEDGAAVRIGSALTGDRVAAVVVSPTCELALALSSHRRIRSVASEPAEPEWALHLPSGSCIAVEGCSLVVESRAAQQGAAADRQGPRSDRAR
jgi:hypothetical protein